MIHWCLSSQSVVIFDVFNMWLLLLLLGLMVTGTLACVTERFYGCS